MKKTIFLLLLVFMVLESFSQIPTNGLMAWYKFNGNAGDSSGFGNHGAVYGATMTNDRFGNPNGAYYFNGSSSYILVPASNSIQPSNALSVSVWFNASPNTNQWQPILSKHISSSYPYDSYLLGTGTPSPVNNRWYGVISNTNNFSQNAITKSTAYNTWTLLTFTYDGSSIKSYINGILDTTNSFSGNIVYNSAGLYIGQNGIGGQYFKGTIDDITIHNRALNDYEIAYMYSPIKNNTISGSQLLCAGALTSILSGNTPTGGTDTINYSYTWISSNLSATDGFNLASGVNDQKDYSPSYIYSTTWFRRIVQSGNSYDTSAAIVITIKPKPSIYIGVNNSSQCITSNSFSFTDNTSYNGSFTRLWNLGNGTIDTTRVANPTKSYGSAGTYYVSYLAIADNGCRDSSILTVSVGTMPSVGFNVNNYVQCAGNAFNFSDTSKASSGSLTRVWNFGGGPNDISTQIYPTKNYVNGVLIM